MTTFQCNTVAQLLGLALSRKKQMSKRKVTFAELARAGGFSSRAYIRDVVEGNKRLTEARIDIFAKILELTAREKKLLVILVKVESNAPGSEDDLKKIHQQLERATRRKTVSNLKDGAITPNTLRVYAGVANLENSRTISQIAEVTALKDAICSEELDRMIGLGWIEQTQERYHCCTDHIVIDQLNQLEFLKRWYLHELSSLQKKAAHDFENRQNMFFTSTFSVNEADKSKLNQDLRNTILNWVDKNSSDVGNQVTNIVIGFQ